MKINLKIVYSVWILALIAGCAMSISSSESEAEPRLSTDIVLVDQIYSPGLRRAKRVPTVSLFEIKGHEYIITANRATDSGIAIIHAASCPMDLYEKETP